MKIVTSLLPDRYVGMQQVGVKLLDKDFIFWEPDKKPMFDMLEDIQPDVILIDLKYVDESVVEASKSTKAKLILFGNGVPQDLNVRAVCTVPSVSPIVKKHLENGDHKVTYIKDYADVCTIFGGEVDPLLQCDIGYISHDKNPDKLMKKLEIFSALNNHNLKIVGNVKIPIPKFLGGIKTNRISSFMKSCKILIDYDGDILLDAAANGAFVLSNTINSLYPILDSENIKKFLSPDSPRNKIAKNRQATILANDTCYHRFAQLMTDIDELDIAEKATQEAIKCAAV